MKRILDRFDNSPLWIRLVTVLSLSFILVAGLYTVKKNTAAQVTTEIQPAKKTGSLPVKKETKEEKEKKEEAHPECKADVLAEADYIGSTAGIIKYAEESDASEFIIVTVRGVLYELERRCQGTGKKFYFPAVQPTCVNMDLITLEKLVRCLETGEGEVQIGVSDEAADQAKLTLDRMLEYAAR